MTGSWLTRLHPRHAWGLGTSRHRLRRAAMRRGTSLLEVMFAMGVAIIGLLGVAALIPVAAQRMGRGVQADQAAAYGRAVVAEFDIRGMGQKRNFTWNPGTGTFVRFQEPGAFCLDPLVVFENPALNRFPASGGVYSIPRVTLARFSTDPIFVSRTPAQQQALVDSLFRFHDDLVFNRPVDRTLPPVQLYSSAPVPLDPIKRQYTGRFTWMATLSPSRLAAQSDLYTLSVVVFEGRDPDPATEVVMPVTFLGLGLGGGDVELGGPAPAVDIRPDDWVMLSTATTPNYVRWYRVASADPESANGTTKYAYLIGADWDPTVVTHATLVQGIVGVFERTFRLEDSSLWKIK